MNAVFNLNRFINLEKRNLLNHKNHFCYVSLTLIGYFIFSVLLFFIIGNQLFINTIYPFSFIFIACAPGFFEKGIRKENSTFDFILPASTFEKFLNLIINYTIILPLICYGSILILTFATELILGDKAKIISEALSASENIAIKNYLGALGFQSILLIGYTYFKRLSFVKTILSMIGTAVILQIIIISTGAIFYIFNSDNGTISSSDFFRLGGESSYTLELLKKTKDIGKIILTIIFPFGFWFVSFLKLREKEL